MCRRSTLADPPARLGAFIARWIGILGANPGYAAIAERDLRRLSPERQAIVMDKRAAIHRFVRGDHRAGIAEGYFDPVVDPGIMTNSLFDVLNGIEPAGSTRRGRLSYDELAEHLRASCCAGWAATPPRGPALP